jgi:hypothetical protein
MASMLEHAFRIEQIRKHLLILGILPNKVQ